MKITTICRVGNQRGVGFYRIPGLVRTPAGTLLCVCEARAVRNDWAGIDLTLLRSEDGGETWSAPQVLAAGISENTTVNNPVLFAKPNGSVLLLWCVEYGLVGRGGVYCRESADDGVSWGEIREISVFCAPEMRNVIALGPGHGICRRNGQLTVPVWLVPKSAGMAETSHHPAEVHLLTSVDNGATWELSPKVPEGGICDPNETAAAELADGHILLDIRAQGLGCRATAVGDGVNFLPMQADGARVDPTCFGSLAAQTVADEAYVFAVNCAHTSERRNLVLSVRRESETTWKTLTICESAAGYADIAVEPDGTVDIVFEDDGSFAILRMAKILRDEWMKL